VTTSTWKHYAELNASPFWKEHLERKLRFYEASLSTDLAKKGALGGHGKADYTPFSQ